MLALVAAIGMVGTGGGGECVYIGKFMSAIFAIIVFRHCCFLSALSVAVYRHRNKDKQQQDDYISLLIRHLSVYELFKHFVPIVP